MKNHPVPRIIKPLRFPLAQLKRGYFTDSYFVKSRDLLSKLGHKAHVRMQIFCKHRGILCGIKETVSLLEQCLKPNSRVKIMALQDGDQIKPWETVMTLEGDYSDFAIYETVYLGILARRTAIATNVRRAVQAAGGKPVFFFGARFDHFLMQEGDGYAALIGGANGLSTDANGSWAGVKGMGTIPHALIASFKGDTAAACEAFDSIYGPGADKRNPPVIALVDFDNDSVKTSLEVARRLGRSLGGVRLDTAENLTDRAIRRKSRNSRGVSAELVWNVRKALDREGFRWVKIIVSGGFNEEKLRRFVRLKVPFDAVGIGSWLYRDRIDFTADVVELNGKHCAKVGRKYHPNPRLRRLL